MKFYNREKELIYLKEKINSKYSEFVYLYGRRRIGKTTLIKKVLEGKKFLYFYIGKKTKKEILDDLQFELEKKGFNIFGKFRNFRDFLEFIFNQKDLIIVFDEFQNFFEVDKSFFSDLQNYWDNYKDKIKIKFFFLGSMFTLIKEIFENYAEPLYGRKTGSLKLEKFSLNTQKEILKDLKIYSEKNLLDYFSVFYGVPKYYEVLLKEEKVKKNILDNIFVENSIFLNEGKNIIIEEFKGNYKNYFSILTAIAVGKTKKSEIADYSGIKTETLGKYLQDLEDYYELITRQTPIFTQKEKSKLSRYEINDLFLKFWFRYIYKRRDLIELGNIDTLKDYVKKDFNNFLGHSFEKFCKEIFIENNKTKQKKEFIFTQIGSYWNRQNFEIDIILHNEFDKKNIIIECKLNEKKITKENIKKFIEASEKIKEISMQEKKLYFFTPEQISKEKQDLLKEYNIGNLNIGDFIT